MFSLSKKAKTEISIYNLKGEKIKTLLNAIKNQGSYKLIWNGKNNAGKAVTSGIYFYKMDIDGKTQSTKKFLILK